MRRLRFNSATVILLAGLLASPVIAQTVMPQPATTIDPILIEYTLLESACGCSIETTTAVEGFDVALEATASCWPNAQRCTPPSPLVLRENIGTFRPGTYDLSISGTVNGNPVVPGAASFTVVEGPFGDLAAPVPGLGRWGLVVMTLLVGSLGVLGARRVSTWS